LKGEHRSVMNRRRLRTFSKTLSILLSFCLLFSLIGPEFAQAAPSKIDKIAKKSEKIEADIGEMPRELPKEKLELKSKRTKFSKRYLNRDGSFTEEIFLEPQFYQDRNNKQWKKIDNTLQESEQHQDKFENKSHSMKVFFTKQYKQNELVEVTKDHFSIKMVPVNGKQSNGVINKNKITYSDLFENTDVTYKIQGDSVKEDIILKSKPTHHIFSFELKLK